jgi:hypothetical protein
VTDVLIVNDNLIAQAVRDLSIDVPVIRAEAHGDGGLKLWLYGGQGEPVTWEPKAKAKADAKVEAKAEPKPKRKPKPKPKAG